jgi:flavin reductase (DIM6/NTAB) family NADH-FMN oxidoreductase RutF
VALDVEQDRTIAASDRLKDVVGHFATGVVVVTGVVDDEPAGFTLQSFVSLSLAPPLVLVCPARGSSTWPRLRHAETICLNVLAEDQQSLSNRFARSSADRFAAVPWSPSPGGAPVLSGVCAWLEGRLRHEYDGGDHTIAVLEVTDLDSRAVARPLLFHRAGYGLHSTFLRHRISLDEGTVGWDW